MSAAQLAKALRPIGRRIGNLFTRGTVLDVETAGGRVRVKTGLRAGEVADLLELFEPFGYSAPPVPDKDGVLVINLGGGHRVAINAGGRYHRPRDLQPGESCVYNQHGDRVTIRNDRGIYVDAVKRVVVNTRAAEVNSETSTVNASQQAAIVSPAVTIDATFTRITNALQVDGNINCRGMIFDRIGSMQAMRSVFNGHDHSGDDGGSTSTPRQRMS